MAPTTPVREPEMQDTPTCHLPKVKPESIVLSGFFHMPCICFNFYTALSFSDFK